MNIVGFTRVRVDSARGHKSFGAILAATCIAPLGGLCAPANAQGLTVELTCVISTALFSFSPPLDSGSSAATVAAKLTGCRSPNGSHSLLHSSTVSESSATATGCAPLPMTIRGEAVLLWNDGSTSTLAFDVSTNPASGPLGLSASLNAGRMVGARATAAPLLVTQSGLCGLGGVRSFGLVGGVVTFTRSSARVDRGVVAKLREQRRSSNARTISVWRR